MSSSSPALRPRGVFDSIDEEDRPTSRFDGAVLGALLSRSAEPSTASQAPSIVGRKSKPPPSKPPPLPARAHPGVLTKSAAILVLPERILPQPIIAIEPLEIDVEIEAPEVVRPIPPPPISTTRLRESRRAHVRPEVRSRGWLRRRVSLVGLLILVACQPWWWNVGDQRSHPRAQMPAPTPAAHGWWWLGR